MATPTSRRPAKAAGKQDSSAEGTSQEALPQRRRKPTTHERFREMILKCIQRDIEPIEVTGGYIAATLAVACVMVTLPLIWLSIAIFAAWMTVMHTVHNTWIITSIKGLTLYLFGIFFGIAIVLFTIKPFFGGFTAASRPKRLKREAEPVLFEYVDQICDAVGAPKPSSIRINCEVNASAQLRHGIFSIFSNDLVLTIGLPLVYGLTLRQLSGVLAHEFGHFAQTGGMRFSCVTMLVNHWLARSLQPDHWDEWLYGQSKELPGYICWIFYLVRVFVWGFRKVMLCLLLFGHAISCLLSRQMEFDADRHEARLAGCTVFESTARRLRGLSIANYLAMNDLHHFSTEGRLVDDLPRYIVASIDQITPELKKALAKGEREEKTQLFDTHPADNDRIRNARAEKTDGVMKLPEIAERLRGTVLFRDIDRISRAATIDLYREMFNKKIKAEKLASVDDLIERRNAEKEAAKALLRYFQVEMPEFYPFPLSEQVLEVPTDLKATAKRVKSARMEMIAALPKYRDTAEHFEFAEQALVESTTALTVLDADLSLDYAEFRLQHPTREFAEFRLENAQTAVENLAATMIDFETAAGARLTAALQLLIHPEACKSIENGESLREEMLRLIPTARLVSSLIGKLPSLRTNCMAMMTLISKLDGEVGYRTAEAIYERIERLHKQLTTLFKLLGDSPYPFDHSDESTTLRDFVLFDVPPMDQLDAMVYMAQSSFERLISVQMRLFARLAQAAEAVETTLGMPPLPEPKPRKRPVDDDDDE